MISGLILKLLIPVLVGPLAYWLSETAQRFNRWLDDRGSTVKQAVTLAITTGLTSLATLIPQLCPPAEACTLETMDMKVLAGWAVAMAVHGAMNAKKRRSD